MIKCHFTDMHPFNIDNIRNTETKVILSSVPEYIISIYWIKNILS